MHELIQSIKNSSNSKILINTNLQKIKDYLNIDISTFNTTQIKILLLNPNFNVKCSCGKDKKFGRNKYYQTCGDIKCNRLSASKTTFDKFGVTNASQSILIKQKKLESYKQNNIQNSELLTKNYIEDNFIDENNNFKVLDFISFYGYANDCAPYRILKEFNINFTKLTRTSHQEKEVLKYIQSITTASVLSNERNIIDPLELDIFIPDSNIAIEYNGLYWHSYGSINTSIKQSDKLFQQNRHIDKTKQFEDLSQTHQMFHIFENEWLNNIKQDIWKSIISDKFKLNYRVYARDTIIKLVDSSEANQFIFENHIQGIRNAPIRLGLYKNNELLSIMTFGKPFTKSECEYELVRFCNKKFTSVIGGASKLLKYFERNYNPKSILSYANRRWSRGNLYYHLGFELQNISKPNKFIINWTTKILHNRLEFQKHKLEEKLEFYDSTLSADQNIINNNYRIIWDCGNYVFTKNYKHN